MSNDTNLEVRTNQTLELNSFRNRRKNPQIHSEEVLARVLPFQAKKVEVKNPIKNNILYLSIPQAPLGPQYNPLTGRFET